MTNQNVAAAAVAPRSIADQILAAQIAAVAAQGAFELAALAVTEGRSTPAAYEQAAGANTAAQARVKMLQAAKVAADQRDVKEAKEAEAAAKVAELEEQRAQLIRLKQSAVAWDTALDALAAAADAFGEVERGCHGLNLPGDTLRRVTAVRGRAMLVMGARMPIFFDDQYKVAGFHGEQSRLAFHVPQL